jgi:hypothetical protein
LIRKSAPITPAPAMRADAEMSVPARKKKNGVRKAVLLGLVWVNSDHAASFEVGSSMVRPPQQR